MWKDRAVPAWPKQLHLSLSGEEGRGEIAYSVAVASSSFDIVILTKQFNFFARRFRGEGGRRSPDGERRPLVRPKQQHQLLGNFLGDLHSFPSATPPPRLPSSPSERASERHGRREGGLLCFHPSIVHALSHTRSI